MTISLLERLDITRLIQLLYASFFLPLDYLRGVRDVNDRANQLDAVVPSILHRFAANVLIAVLFTVLDILLFSWR